MFNKSCELNVRPGCLVVPARSSRNKLIVGCRRGIMAVSYEDAVSTLKQMFADTPDEVIKARLEANGGHMENTVNDLLAMASGEAPPRNQQCGTAAVASTVEHGATYLCCAYLPGPASSCCTCRSRHVIDTDRGRTRPSPDPRAAKPPRGLSAGLYADHGPTVSPPPVSITLTPVPSLSSGRGRSRVGEGSPRAGLRGGTGRGSAACRLSAAPLPGIPGAPQC